MARSKLLDAYGRPVDASLLTEELGTVRLASIRTPFFPSQADGLEPERLAMILHAAEVGQILEYLTLAIEMEEREPHYSSVLSTRKHAVAGLTAKVEAASEKAADVALAEELQGLCESDHFEGLLIDSLDALGKGFSACETMWDTSEGSWYPREFKYRDPRHFVFDRETHSELRMRDESDPVWGLPLAPFKWIQHRPHIRSGIPIRGGFARLAVVLYMAKGYALKDWLAFAEVFGMPLRIGKYDSGASPKQKAELLAAVTNIGTDAAAIIPDSMMVEFVAADKSAGGDKLFEGLADWLDRQTSKAVLGQTMTTDDGSSRAQAEVHDGVRKDLVRSDARQLAASLRRDLVKPYVDLNHGRRKEQEYPRLLISIEEKEDLKGLADSVTPFIDRGLEISMVEVRDKFGLGEPEVGAVLLSPVTKVGGSGTPSEPDDAEGDVESEDDEGGDEVTTPAVPPARAPKPPKAEPRPGYDALGRRIAVDADGGQSDKKAAPAKMNGGGLPLQAMPPTTDLGANSPNAPDAVKPQRGPSGTFAQPPRQVRAYEPATARALGAAVDVLTARIVEGATLTPDQRRLLELATREAGDQDTIDELAARAGGKALDPLLSSIEALAARVETEEEFLRELARLALPVDELVRTVALLTFQARGLGDATDHP